MWWLLGDLLVVVFGFLLLGGPITLAQIDSAGLVYASNGYGAFKAGNGTLVFMPFERVAAAVR